jgi:hypothetical protein
MRQETSPLIVSLIETLTIKGLEVLFERELSECEKFLLGIVIESFIHMIIQDRGIVF